MTRLDISIGPVQGFVGQSRRTRDLWGSSYLLSVLSGYAMHGAEQAGGRIVSPVVKGNPMYGWIRGDTNGEAPRLGLLPNHFVVETDELADGVADAAIRSLEDAWRGVCDAVWRDVAADIQDAGHGTDIIWERQTRNFWEIMWTAGTDPKGGGLLARRKQWRTHRPADEPGDKCTVMHDLQELSGYVRATGGADRERQDEFWERIRDHRVVGRLNLRENERLCAVALVKRLFPLVPKALDWHIDASRWPSTVYIAAVPWIERVGSVAPEDGERYAREVGEVAPPAVSARPPLASVDHPAGAFARMDANWLHADFVRDERRCPLPGDSTGVRERLLDGLSRLSRIAGKPGPASGPSTFYALLKADGDHLGKLVSRAGPRAGPEPVGRALARFTREVPNTVEAHQGVTVYAGGDDVLAMLPAPGALSCAEALSNLYRSAFRDGVHATLSAAVLFAHVRSPLRSALAEANRLLEEVAKDSNDRDSLAAGVLKPGGLHCQWVTTWSRRDGGRESRAVTLVGDLALRLGASDAEPGISASLLYGVRETLSLLCDRPRWEPGSWDEPPPDLDLAAFLRAEIFRSLGHRSGGEEHVEAEKLVRLVLAVLPRSRAGEADAAPVGVDGLLLARFLAAPDAAGVRT